MNGIQLAHTADLPAATLAQARALLDEAFAGSPDGDMTDEDWEHGLGGTHALAWADGVLVGHAALVQRRLLYGQRALRAGYVEAVAVRAGDRRHGYGAAMMTELERLIRGGYDIGAPDVVSSSTLVPSTSSARSTSSNDARVPAFGSVATMAFSAALGFCTFQA